MFKFFKKKLKNWTKKLSKESEKSEKIEETGEKSEKSKIIPIPTKFNNAIQGYEPDLEKLKEIQKEVEQKKTPKPGTKIEAGPRYTARPNLRSSTPGGLRCVNVN